MTDGNIPAPTPPSAVNKSSAATTSVFPPPTQFSQQAKPLLPSQEVKASTIPSQPQAQILPAPTTTKAEPVAIRLPQVPASDATNLPPPTPVQPLSLSHSQLTSSAMNAAPPLVAPPTLKMETTPLRPSAPASPPSPVSAGGGMSPGLSRPTPLSVSSPPPAPKPTPSAPTKPPQQAIIRRSPLRFLPVILGGLLMVGAVGFVLTRILHVGVETTSGVAPLTGSTASQPVVLTYWGLWEDNAVLQGVLADFESKNPNIKVNYQQQTYQNYRERLQAAISSQRGPDIFRFHASWTPMLRNELSPMPASVMSGAEFQNTFYPVAAQQLSLSGQIYGIPLMYDGLALYYNQDALRTANVSVPSTWHDLKSAASQLTILSGGSIQRAGLAIGTAGNVDHFSDILGLLMLQNGADPSKPTSQAAEDALQFYTNFFKVDHVWDTKFANSTVAFARGDVAMMFAPSWRVHDIKAMSPNLKFGIAPVPQLGTNKVTWATYWAEGVNSQSQHKAEAWALLKYLSSADVMNKLYSSASKERTFGELYSRKDLASQLANDPYASSYLADAPIAKGWYLNSATHDDGLNDQLIKYYTDAVNAVNSGTDVTAAMNVVAQGTAQVLQNYNVPASR